MILEKCTFDQLPGEMKMHVMYIEKIPVSEFKLVIWNIKNTLYYNNLKESEVKRFVALIESEKRYLNERCQEYFMQNESRYEAITKKLYIIGVYGNAEDNPDFLNTFIRQYHFENVREHVLGLERHKYGHKMKDFLIEEDDVKEELYTFIKGKYI